MFVAESHKLIYLCPPKTATNSLGKVLEAEPFNAYIPAWKHAHHTTVWEEKWRTWFIFITTRHPYRRAVSFWKFINHEVSQGLDPSQAQHWHPWTKWWLQIADRNTFTFSECLKWPRFQSEWTGVWRCHYHLEQIPRPIDCIVHLERLREDLDQIPALKSIELERRNTGPKLEKPWHEYYDEETAKLVQELWPDDFEKFDYTRDIDACAKGEWFV